MEKIEFSHLPLEYLIQFILNLPISYLTASQSQPLNHRLLKRMYIHHAPELFHAAPRQEICRVRLSSNVNYITVILLQHLHSFTNPSIHSGLVG